METMATKIFLTGPIEPLPVNQQDRLYSIMRERIEAEIWNAFGPGPRVHVPTCDCLGIVHTCNQIT